MTNDLFRDLLEGRQPLRVRAMSTVPNPEVQAILALCHHDAHHVDCPTCNVRANEGGAYLARIGKALIESFDDTPPPADPRARALWAKEQQGHGPAMTPLRVRGRTTHYKEKR